MTSYTSNWCRCSHAIKERAPVRHVHSSTVGVGYINAVCLRSYQTILKIHRGMPGCGTMADVQKARVTVSEGYSSCEDSADEIEVVDDKRRPRAKVGTCNTHRLANYSDGSPLGTYCCSSSVQVSPTYLLPSPL